MLRLLKFEADWCGPCKTQDDHLDELESDYDVTGVDIEKIDIETEDGQQLANEYTVRSIPTMVIEDDDGPTERFDGVTPAETLADAIEETR